ncbi:MAG: RNase adapter RapZ, partial [Pseudomonadota bacterium]
LEDSGFYCIDNLPLSLVSALTDELRSREGSPLAQVALGIDARNAPADLARLPQLLDDLHRRGVEARVVFLESDDRTLLQRFSETRRRHPLTSADRTLAEALALERRMLEPFRVVADLALDTTHTNLHQLRELIRERVVKNDQPLSLLFQSFGFKRGAPRDADLMFDARCLPNPYWEPGLRALTGRDEPVQAFLSSDERTGRFLDQIAALVEDWLPCFQQEGRSYLTVAIGCTGGQHRSVYLVEKLAAHFRSRELDPLVLHREIT